MSSDQEFPRPLLEPTGPMYIVDLVAHLRARNHTSALMVTELVWAAERYGATYVNAHMLGEDVCLVRTHIGFGLSVEVEMERDREGRWKAVFGQIVKP